MDQVSTSPRHPALKMLHESADSVFYYSEDKNYPGPVIIKALKTNSPDPLWLQQFYNEYEITKDLNIKGVRKAYGIDKLNGSPCIILEYIEGRSIKEIITDK